MPQPKTAPAAEPPKSAADLAAAASRAADLEALGAWLAVARSEAGELIAGGERLAHLVEQLRGRTHQLGYETRLAANADRVRDNLLHYATWYAERHPRTVPHIHTDRGQTYADILPAYAWDCLRQGRIDYALTRGAQAGYLRPYPERLHAYFGRPRSSAHDAPQTTGRSQAEAEAAADAQGGAF